MQNSSNPNSAGLSRPPKRFLKKGFLTFATCIALADEVFAQSTTSPCPPRPGLDSACMPRQPIKSGCERR
jgi:hypothetical protein